MRWFNPGQDFGQSTLVSIDKLAHAILTRRTRRPEGRQAHQGKPHCMNYKQPAVSHRLRSFPPSKIPSHIFYFYALPGYHHCHLISTISDPKDLERGIARLDFSYHLLFPSTSRMRSLALPSNKENKMKISGLGTAVSDSTKQGSDKRS